MEGGREIKSITKRTRILFTIYNSKLLKEKEKFWNWYIEVRRYLGRIKNQEEEEEISKKNKRKEKFRPKYWKCVNFFFGVDAVVVVVVNRVCQYCSVNLLVLLLVLFLWLPFLAHINCLTLTHIHLLYILFLYIVESL